VLSVGTWHWHTVTALFGHTWDLVTISNFRELLDFAM